MADRRVAVTGLGAITAAGVGIDETWAGLLDGTSRVQTFSLFDPGNFACKIAAQLDEFSARNFVPKSYRKGVKIMARDIEIAVACADLGFRDAGVTTRGIDPDNVSVEPKRVGCNIGAGLISPELNELGHAVNTAVSDGKFDYALWGQTGMTNLTPLWLLKYLPNMLSCHVTIIHGTEGPSNCITCGDASGHLAVGESVLYIRRNSADIVIAGGAESKLNPMGLLRQSKLGRLCTSGNDKPAEAIRPFDADHAGMAIGEGGGLLILEDMDCAKARGAKIYAEVVGFGGACDPQAIDVERPTAGNLGLAVRRAMSQAGIAPADVDLIAANGTGVPGEDVAEAAEWHKVLGDTAVIKPAYSLGGAIGTMFAGQSGVQLAVAAKALSEQTVPPTANFTNCAAGCDLNLSAEARPMKIRYAVAGAFTVGGQSGAVVLKAFED